MDGKMSSTVAGALDYKGFPADRAKTGGWVPAALILGIEICERLSTMGIAVNLVTYLVNTMHLPSAESANVVTDFMGTSFLLCLLGGFLADTFLGRYLTIAIFAVVQSMGTGTLALATHLPQLRPAPCNGTSCERAKGKQMGVLYFALYLIALGTGGLKSSVSGFGTDQFDDKDAKEKAQMTYFFQRFFFFISMGTLMAVTVLVYIQDEVGRSWAYAICCISMLTAILIFLSGTRRYRYKQCSGSPVVHIAQVVAAAFRKRKVAYVPGTDVLYEEKDGEDDSRIQHTTQFRCLDKAAVVVGNSGSSNKNNVNPWELCSVTRVEEVKMMIRLLPVWATTILFWTTYAQMITFSVEQATTMRRNLGSFQIPAGSLTVFFVGAILISIAVYDRVIMPLCKKYTGKPGLTDLQRIALGLVLSILGMAAAAVAEAKRLSVARSAEGMAAMSAGKDLPISVYVLIPQFFLVGAGEAFIYTGQLDFFLTRSPKSMKTMSTGLFLSTLSLGFFFSTILVTVVKAVTGGNGGDGWLADDINRGRLDLFYGLVSVLSLLNFGAYLISAYWSRPRQQPNGDGGMQMATNGESGGDDKC